MTQQEARRRFGNPCAKGALSALWRDREIISVPLPYPMRLAWDPETTVTRVAFHRAAAPRLTAALTALWHAARLRVKERHGYDRDTAFYDAETKAYLASLGLDLLGGTFNFRVMRGGASLSMHAYGIAIDLNPAPNALGTRGVMPAWVVDAFEAHGFTWGGRWKGKRCDPMHFELK